MAFLLKNNYFIEFHDLRGNFDRTNLVFLLSYGVELCQCSLTPYLCNNISFPRKSMLLKFCMFDFRIFGGAMAVNFTLFTDRLEL